MTMIGLFTGAPRGATTAIAGEDGQGATGFGTALQDVLASLAGNAAPKARPGMSTDAEPEPEQMTAQPSRTEVQTPTVIAQSWEGVPAGETLPLMEAPQSSPNALTVPAALSETGGVALSNPAVTFAPPAAVLSPSSPTAPTTVGTPVSRVDSPAIRPGNATVLSDAAPPVVGISRNPASGLGSTDSAGSPVVLTPAAEPEATLPSGSAVPATAAPVKNALSSAVPAAVAASSSPVAGGASPVEISPSAPLQPASSPLPVVAETRAPASGAAAVAAPTVAPDHAAEGPRSSEASTVSTSGLGAAHSNRESASTPMLQPAAAPIGTPVPTGTAAPVAPPSAPAAPAASVPFTAQLAKPIFSLAAAGVGEHVMTVSVTPDNLGPVMVRAHVGAEGVRVELFAPSDLGRDAIRAILPELRRDLAGAGLGGTLDLSEQDQPSDKPAFGSDKSRDGKPGAEPSGNSLRNAADRMLSDSPQSDNGQRRPGLFVGTSTIDVLA